MSVLCDAVNDSASRLRQLLVAAAASPRLDEPCLVIAVDAAWWGGQARDRASHSEVLLHTVLGPETVHPVGMTRVLLGGTFRRNAPADVPNCDPDARLLLEAIDRVIAAHPEARRILIAVDAPLAAAARPSLPNRCKILRAGEVVLRAADEALSAARVRVRSPWSSVFNIQPGAPLFPRIDALRRGLETRHFGLYQAPGEATPDRLLIETFPGEALWALGNLGHFGTLTPSDARAYKPPKRCRTTVPVAEIRRLIRAGLNGFVGAIGATPAVVSAWIEDVVSHVTSDPFVMTPDRTHGRTGKGLDDAVESANTLFTAVAFLTGTAHVWRSSESPEDGHIVGPGL